MSLDPEAASREGPVATTVTRQIKPGHHAAYEGFLAGLNHAASAFRLPQRGDLPPAPGGNGEYRIVYRFDSAAARLCAWLDSPKRGLARPRRPHVAGPMRTQVLTGLGTTLPAQPGTHHRRPTRWPSSPGRPSSRCYQGETWVLDSPEGV